MTTDTSLRSSFFRLRCLDETRPLSFFVDRGLLWGKSTILTVGQSLPVYPDIFRVCRHVSKVPQADQGGVLQDRSGAIGLSAPSSLVHDHRSEPISDHRFGTADHLIDDAGRGHQSLGLTDGFAGQQAHLFEITRELWGWRKSTKPLHRNFLSIKAGLTNHRKLRIRNHPVWRRIVMPFPFPHDAVAQPASRSIREFRTEDQMAGCILDASSNHALLVLRMGISLEARE